MIAPLSQRYLPAAQAALRIVAGSAYFVHATQKLFGWFGGLDGHGRAAELMSKFGAAGVIEVVLSTCIVLGLATRLAAFIASGEMAVAYLMVHIAGSGSIWWWQNGGELPVLFSFLFLLYAAWGAGPLSVDSWLERRRPSRTSTTS